MNSVLQRVTQYDIKRLLKSVIVSFAICIAFGMTTSNVLYLLTGCLYFIVCEYENVLEKKEKWVNIVLSILFSLFMTLGTVDTILDAGFLPWPIRVILCCFGFYFIFSFFISHFLVCLRNAQLTEKERVIYNHNILKVFAISFVCLLVVWVVGLAISYPGNTTKDSNVFFAMALGERDMWAAISPLYILAIRFFLNMGLNLFGNVNAGLALFSFSQILILTTIISYLISQLYRFGIKKWVCVIVWLFYAIVPYNVQLSHTIWRDVPFSACVFAFAVLVWNQYMEGHVKITVKNILKWMVLIVSIVGMCILKGNGLFAYIFFLPFGIFLFFKKNKGMVVALFAAFVLARVVQGPVSDKILTENARFVAQKAAEESANTTDSTLEENIENAETSAETQTVEVQEVKNATDSYNASGIYIVTGQQLARVIVDRTDLSAEEYERLNRIIDVERIREKYDPNVSDKTLGAIRYGVPMTEYLKEWIYFGLKYPVQYVLAFKDQTYGYWYPDVQRWVYFDTIRENEYGLYRDSILSDGAKEVMEKIEDIYLEMPVYGMLWSIGFAAWTTLFFMGVSFVKKGNKAMLLYTPVLGVWATLLVASPVYAEFRYIYSMFLCLPLSILIPFMKKNVTE